MAAFVAKQVVGNKLNAVKGTHYRFILFSKSYLSRIIQKDILN